MAKSNSIFDFQGTFEGKTFVRSKTYGDHVRTARGTHKRADINESCRQASARIIHANVPAKIIKDAIDPYRQNFKGGQLWQRLVSQFRKQLRAQNSFDFSKIERIEVHEQHRLSRLISLRVESVVDTMRNELRVTLFCSLPKFRSASLNGYRLGVIAIFPDVERKISSSMAAYSNTLNIKENPGTIELLFPLPENFDDYVLCAIVEGCENGVVYSSPSNKGMCIVERG